jgi:hypothetical protein
MKIKGVIIMNKKLEFLDQLREVNRKIEELEELREDLFFRLDEFIDSEGELYVVTN